MGHKEITKRDPTTEEKMEQAAAWLDRTMASNFGKLLKRMMTELQFADTAGNLYQFGSREGSRQATYVCRRIKEGEQKRGPSST